ncbi:MAG: tRNA (adenosine(37)-N6)-threonylcarbamoyltransferase complex ATPase subunit type 1 TsaE [Candidatus Pacebacteria bacterium]|nr:tRNA (adenosine(37)-N6)-threonylcarbamoyltransferase complex ATPase subunit type 1 TsaE [Candidatus Paceibacterota bacterium]MDD5356843.1 tRNA (adenosine(37)-N6)-threonylcarbamoyltransferase complex ATPase subunit type 1 TsaE [Candidatus Paceibacterota bacterium]
MKKVSKSLEETEKISKDFVSKLPATSNKLKATLVGLHGDLGAGKTTFMKGIAKAFGIEEDITSPTFIIEKLFKLKAREFDHLIHIDAYRLESSRELLNLGWKEISENPKNIIFIEWPEKVSDILPKEMQHIYFKHVDETTREISFE